MNKRFLIMGYIFILILVSPVSLGAESKREKDNRCGPRCLLTICQILGVETNLDELCRFSSMDKDTGTTMLGLYDAAIRLGLKAEGCKMDIGGLVNLKSPVIAHIKGDHFFVIEQFENNEFCILDSPKEPYELTKEELSEIWDGNVLVLSKRSTNNTESPNIIFEEYLYHFGKADQNEKIEHIYRFKNTGKQPLLISKVRTTCGCMAALLSNKEISLGEEGEIKATFSTGGRRGKQSQIIYVHSNDPDEPLLKLTLTGKIKAYMVISPQELYFGSVKINKGAIRRISIFEGEERLNITQIESSSKYLFTNIFNILYDKKMGYEVIVALSPGMPIGLLNEKVIIHTNSKKKPKIEIPITGQVEGPISIYPNMFFFGFVKRGESLSRKVTLSIDESENWEIVRMENTLDCVLTGIQPIEGGNGYKITATLSPDVPEGVIKGKIKIYTSIPDQSVIEVPVYALVEG